MTSQLITLSPTYHPKFDNHTTIENNEGAGQTGYSSPSANEIMRGPLTLLSSSHGPRQVILSIFRTSVDHFALVYPDNRRKVIALKPAGCINLRGVTCYEEKSLGPGIKGFTLRPKKCDTSSAALIFLCEETSQLPKWMSALEPTTPINGLGQRRTPRLCSLPSVEEED